MKRLLTLFILLMAVASCAMGQSPIPKLMLDEEVLNSGSVYRTEDGVEIESGSEEDGTYLYTWYDDQGYLDGYEMQFDCGCEILFEGYGVIDEHMSFVQEGHVHEAPVKQRYVLKMLDSNLLDAVEALTGTRYSLEELKTPATRGELKALSDTVFTVEDKGYDEVFMYANARRYQAELGEEDGKKIWTATFAKRPDPEDVRFVVRQGDKITHFGKQGRLGYISISNVCEYEPEADVFEVYGRFKYGSRAIYDGNGAMISYGYHPPYAVNGNMGRYMSVSYDTKNRLIDFEYDNAEWDRWIYIRGDGWYFCDYDEDEPHKETPPPEVVAMILPPILTPQYTVSAATSVEEMKGEEVPFALVDQTTKAALVEIGAELKVKPKLQREEQKNQVQYDIAWSNDAAWQVIGSGGVNLVIPWPYGLDLAWAKQHEFTIEHEVSPGRVETFSTVNGTAQLNEAGLLCRVHKFSPFIMNWGTEAEMQQIVNLHEKGTDGLPSTGDNSHLFLWLGLLAAGLCAYAARRRIRA